MGTFTETMGTFPIFVFMILYIIFLIWQWLHDWQGQGDIWNPFIQHGPQGLDIQQLLSAGQKY